MRDGETKEDAFKRLATNRTNRILKDLSLLSNLSNRNNYSYDEKQVRKIFRILERELKNTGSQFNSSMKSVQKLEL